jgi:hypothetical protein
MQTQRWLFVMIMTLAGARAQGVETTDDDRSEIARLREQVLSLERRLAILEGKSNTPTAAQAAPKPAKVGQIFVVGNEKTPTAAILKKLALSPGQVVDREALRNAERTLGTLHSAITVLDAPGESEFRDVLVTVRETEAGAASDDRNLEEKMYSELREKRTLREPRYAMYVRNVDGHRLNDVIFKHRGKEGTMALILRAREGEIKVDADQKRILFHFVHVRLWNTEGQATGTCDDLKYFVPLAPASDN